MLIPRFTLRWLLLLITFISVFCLIVAQAVRGQAWAIGLLRWPSPDCCCAFVLYGVLFGAGLCSWPRCRA